MKTQTHTNLGIRSVLALALAVATWIPTTASAADEPMKPMKGGEHQMMVNPKPNANAESADGKMMMGGRMMTETNMMQQCQAMMAQKEKMMADMKAQDAELTEQIAKMNSAPQDKKTDLMAAVLTQMVEQRTAMNARMAKMQDEMMQHMMQHMQMGKESMAQCPMMKGMDEESADAHKGHQDEQK